MIDLSKMTVKQLRELREKIDGILPAKMAEAKRETVDAMRALASTHGFDLSEVLGTSKAKRNYKPSKALRDKSGKVWAGRGRRPDGFDMASARPV